MLRTVPVVMVILSSLTVAGCSRVPEGELEQAQAALERAREAEADRYARDAWYEARAALERAKLEIDAQAKRFALRRSYEKTHRLLADAKSAAEFAREAAVIGREEFRQEAEHALARAAEALLEAKTIVDGGLGVQRSETDVDTMKSELKEAGASLDAANAEFEAGDYIAARAHADAVRARVRRIVQDLASPRNNPT